MSSLFLKIKKVLVQAPGPVLAGLILAGGAVYAWTEPTTNPPASNAPAPLNVSGTAQEKLGGLIINSGGAPIGLVIPSGNVGIGTTNPSANLNINGSSYLLGGSGDVNEDGRLDIGDAMFITQYLVGSRQLTPSQYAKADINGDGQVTILDVNLISKIDVGTITLDQAHHSVGKYKSDSVLQITYDGNVGIGTTDPGSYKLNVAGDINATGKLCIAGDCKATWPAVSQWITTGSNIYYNTGNVGIGTNNPQTKLVLYDSASGPILSILGLDTKYRGLKIADTSNNEKWFAGSDDSNNYVVRRNGATNDLTVGPTGIVYIAGPMLFATTTSQDYFMITAKKGIGLRLDADNNDDSRFTIFAGSGVSVFTVDETGTLIQGSIPWARVTDAPSGSQWTDTTGGIYYNSGNVGIGTTNPSVPLEVVRSDGGAPTIKGISATNYTNIEVDNLSLTHQTSATMADGFGVGLNFYIGKTGQSNKWIANIAALRDGADDQGKLIFRTSAFGNTLIPGLTIDYRQNVGIGPVSPASRLHIKDGNAWGSDLSLDPSGITGGNGRRWMLISTTKYASEGEGKFLIKDNNASEVRMTVDTAGNVGIGTTDPGAYRLNVAGDINATGKLCIAGDCKASWPSGGSSQWTDTTGGIYYNSGSVGIGTTQPSKLFDSQQVYTVLHGHDSTKSALVNLTNSSIADGFIVGAIQFGTMGTAAADKRSAMIMSTLSGDASANVSGSLAFFTSNAGQLKQRMLINKIGSVGIDTFEPSSRLHLYGGQTWGSDLSIDAGGTTGGRRWLLISTGGDAGEGQGKFLVKDNTTGAGVRMTVDTTGNVGIGTTGPGAYRLNVAGDINATGKLCIAGDCKATWPAGSQWITTGSNIYYNSGNVGIGVTSPYSKLHVDGVIGVNLISTTGVQAGLVSRQTANPKSGSNIVLANLAADFRQNTINNSWGSGIKFTVGNASTYTGTAAIVAERTGSWSQGKLHFAVNNAGAPDKLDIPIYMTIDGPSGGNVGIGTTGPGAKLEVTGQVKITGGSPGTGKVLTSDADGLASWKNAMTVGTVRFTYPDWDGWIFIVPEGVTKVWVSMAGGGGGGGGSSSGYGGGGGGGGRAIIAQEVPVSSGEEILIKVGAGGTGGRGGENGTQGQESSFGGYISTFGGAGGKYDGTGGTGGPISGSAYYTGDSPDSSTGSYGTPSGAGGAGGNGGGSIFGVGGAGGNGGTGTAANTGSKGGGYGGGGGGGARYGIFIAKGGDGAPGFVLVEW